MAFLFFVGGTSSGKSKLAQAWAEAAASERILLVTFHAKGPKTAASDHKNKGNGWLCIEEPLEPLGALKKWNEEHPGFNGSFVIDSLGAWIANLMSQNLPISGIHHRVSALADALVIPDCSCAVVSDEYGMGLPPLDSIARKYGDILGAANQIMAKRAHAVLFVTCGLPLALKGAVPAVLSRFNASAD